MSGERSNSVPANSMELRQTGSLSTFSTRWHAVKLGGGARPFGELRLAKPDAAAQPAASITAYGRDRIAAIYFTAGQVYAKDRPAALRAFIHALTRELFPQPMVEVAGAEVDVTVARNHGQLLVHLVNTSGPHATESIIANLAPVGPLSVSIRHPRQPASVTLDPTGRPLKFTYRDGKVDLLVPAVAVHEIIVVAP